MKEFELRPFADYSGRIMNPDYDHLAGEAFVSQLLNQVIDQYSTKKASRIMVYGNAVQNV